jgi:hypothetical protein
VTNLGAEPEKAILGPKYYADTRMPVYTTLVRGAAVAKFTKSIRFGLTPWLFRRIRAEAKRQRVSVNELVRTATERHLGELIWQRVEATQPEAKPRKPSLLETPVVIWPPEEEATAHRAMQLFRNHDE